MYIRLSPGNDFNDYVSRFPNRQYNQLLPIGLTKDQIFDLMPAMTPNSWVVYNLLLWYEHVKFEISTPRLEDMYKHLEGSMSKVSFDESIQELTKLIIKTENDNLEYLVKFIEKSEGAE